MSKKPVAAAEPQASLNIAAEAEQAQAERLAAEQAQAERLAAEQAQAERLAAEPPAVLSTGVLLRRECIAGHWYAHGAVLTCSAELARSLEQDGALDPHPAAVEHALANGALQIAHAGPQPDAE